MDFHQLLAKMQELDTPVSTEATTEAITQECGEPMGMTPPMSSQPSVPPPSLSVNLNAHGLDDIESIMKLIAKVNPDSVPQEPTAPMLGVEPSIMSIKPDNGFDGTGPLKMLPDFDADNDEKVGGEIDFKVGGDDDSEKSMLPEPIDMDGEEDGELDNDEDEGVLGTMAGGALGAAMGGPLGAAVGGVAGDAIGDIGDDKKEAWDNEPDETEKSIDYMNNTLAGGMNRPKGTYPKVAGGDNPMQKVKEDADSLRMQIRAELQRRLAEAKGAE